MFVIYWVFVGWITAVISCYGGFFATGIVCDLHGSKENSFPMARFILLDVYSMYIPFEPRS